MILRQKDKTELPEKINHLLNNHGTRRSFGGFFLYQLPQLYFYTIPIKSSELVQHLEHYLTLYIFYAIIQLYSFLTYQLMLAVTQRTFKCLVSSKPTTIDP